MEYRIANKNDIERIAKLSAKAFKEYPLFNVLRAEFKDKDRYREFLTLIFKIYTKVFIKSHTILLGLDGDKILAVAMMENLNKADVSVFDFILAGGLKTIKYISPFKMLKFTGLLENSSEDLRKFNEAYYLASYAIDDDYHGQGIGTKMLEGYIMDFVRKSKFKLLTLTTQTKDNCRFYEKMGFKYLNTKTLKYFDKEVDSWSYMIEIA